MNDNDLEELLRSRPEPLPAPAGRWEAVRRRARRRRIAKLSVAIAATFAIAGGGLTPMLLRHHDNDSEQRLSVARLPSPLPAHQAAPIPRAARAPLRGFQPGSVSFVSQADGFLLGSTPHQGSVLAQTGDGGRSWSRLADVPISSDDAVGVRFADDALGFVFGGKYLVTTDGGRSWTAEPSPGYINDLETMNGHVYALVSPCASCRRVTLYGATTTSPVLRPVLAVPPMVGDFASLTVYRDSAYVLDTVKDGTGQVWSTLDGFQWSRHSSPCGLSTGLMTQWSPTGVAAVCDVVFAGAGQESKQVFASTDGAQTWTPLATKPSEGGYFDSVSASGPADIVVADERSGLDVTGDGGRHWSFRGPQLSDGASFVGFISPTHVVALPADPSSDRFFMTSYDAGRTWVTTRFPS
jgi:photosystem II stability/assembly factor-like uncharacterized protein